MGSGVGKGKFGLGNPFGMWGVTPEFREISGKCGIRDGGIPPGDVWGHPGIMGGSGILGNLCRELCQALEFWEIPVRNCAKKSLECSPGPSEQQELEDGDGILGKFRECGERRAGVAPGRAGVAQEVPEGPP